MCVCVAGDPNYGVVNAAGRTWGWPGLEMVSDEVKLLPRSLWAGK